MNRKELSYMAATLGMLAQGIEPPTYHKKKQELRSCEKKKCKSCKYFVKNEYGTTCTNGLGRYYTTPLKVACEAYQKRK